ncbi:MAG: pilin [Parcubacteria group bacterium]|jgi:hypothetical protein
MKKKEKKYIIGFSVFLLFCMFAIQAFADEYGSESRKILDKPILIAAVGDDCNTSADCSSGMSCVPCESVGAKCLGNVCWNGSNTSAAASCSETCYPIACPEGTSQISGTCSDQYKCCGGSATNYENSGSVPAGTWGTNVNTQTGGVSSVSGYSGSASGVILPTWSGLPTGTVEGVIFTFLMWLLSIFGFIAIISFIVSGVQYFLAFGEEKNMERAKRNMEYSIIGVVVGLIGVIIIFAVDFLLRGVPLF